MSERPDPLGEFLKDCNVGPPHAGHGRVRHCYEDKEVPEPQLAIDNCPDGKHRGESPGEMFASGDEWPDSETCGASYDC